MTRPRLAFVGVGWIGRARMEAVVAAGAADAAVVMDTDQEIAEKAAAEVGCDVVVTSFDGAIVHDVDGVVLATPSALHAEQALAALECGLPVFCQKPLGRTAAECASVIEAAKRRDLLLGVDLSYRGVRAFEAAVGAARSGELGRVYALDLIFHNSYGPDKAWFRDPELGGGGCLMDLGTHLVDFALRVVGQEPVRVNGALFAGGEVLEDPAQRVEDYASVQLEMPDGALVRIACSWFLPCGRDAVIEAHVHGADGSVAVRNVGGSFYDFTTDRYEGRTTAQLVAPPDDWGGRVLVQWAHALGDGSGYDRGIESVVAVAKVIDAAYGRAA
ncbi:MAG TPA: Gfo/Idh/MocA family oxidoreductase [Actinomycetota bacterium]|nr:Gfo/Idh/MocA family oxidoreductase [Actinomycetota bacterium]